ncbi:RND transporter [Lacimonas salitolerans]|uniref:RND transporter n=1 Tax=Lacimonas salitolerans TaxID=1323750 RepID=A0ABW4ECY8_9RHOB
MTVLDNLSWPVVILLCVVLGGAPFVPEPHLVEKLRMLGQGTLTRPMDILDLAMHGAPFALLVAKIVRVARR